MKFNRVATSSNNYLLYIDDVLSLSDADIYDDKNKKVVILLGNIKKDEEDKLVSGRDVLEQAKAKNNEYIEASFIYYSKPLIVSMIIQLLKFLKRKSHIQSKTIYRVKLSNLLQNDLPRGVRNRENAYNWTNKKWKMPIEERNKRYNDLYDSLATNGYDFKYPMLVAFNRQLGYKDKLLQGHHRIGVCQELGIEDVCVSFWAYPQIFKLGLKKQAPKCADNSCMVS